MDKRVWKNRIVALFMALIMALGVLPAQVFALDGSSPEVSAPAAQQADQQQDQVAPDSATQAQPANDPNPQDQPAPDPAPQAPLAEDAELPDPCGRGRCAVAGRECGFGKKAQGREITTVYKTDI